MINFTDCGLLALDRKCRCAMPGKCEVRDQPGFQEKRLGFVAEMELAKQTAHGCWGGPRLSYDEVVALGERQAFAEANPYEMASMILQAIRRQGYPK